MFAKKYGILIAVEAILVINYALTYLWWSNFGLFFICCSFGHVLHKKSKIAFLAIFGGLLGIFTCLYTKLHFTYNFKVTILHKSKSQNTGFGI
jgi:hypothetical protein